MSEMMIRIDAETLTKLEDLARIHNRTIEEEATELLRLAVWPKSRYESPYEAAVRISAMTPKNRPQIDSVDILREERDS